MPCYHPILATRLKYKNGSYSAPIFGLIDRRTFPSSIKFEEIALPCGKCIGCRLERSRQWAMRCVQEASLHEENSFITLTYDDDHVPDDYSLRKRDWQLFMKRLRKEFTAKKIRFYACGEYGERTFRPHYHAILFGHQFKDRRIQTKQTESGIQSIYVSDTLSRLWPFGFSSSGDMTFESAAYVARYCLKKINGSEAESHYFGREPEFCLMSRMPGIGYEWFKMYQKSIYPNDRCFARGKPCKPPRYFDNCLKKVDEALFNLVKSERVPEYDPERFMTGDNSLKRLFDREKAVSLRQKKLSRGL